MPRLAVIGNVSIDTAIYSDGRRRRILGGAGLHVALAAARAGLSVRPVAVVGDDLGRVRTESRFSGVDWSATDIRSGQSANFTMHYDPQGVLVRLDADYGVAEGLTDHALAYIEVDLDAIFHVCCRRPIDVARILHALNRQGHSFSLDFIVSSAQQNVVAAAPLIDQVDVVFVNAAEYELLTAAVPASMVRTAVITDGPRPVQLRHRGRISASTTPPSRPPVEVTGAGDTLAGTFLAARASGLSEQDALELAVAAATMHVTTAGSPLEKP